MGLIFNGSSDNITASDGNLTITGLDIEGSQNINTTGIITASSVKVTGALTYEDVTNVDSIGIITARDHINISTDNKRLKFGAGDDLNLYSTGTNGWVYTPQSGADLYMGTNAGEVYIQTGSSGNDTAIKVNSGGAVELYHNNAKKFETTADGIQVTGKIFPSSHIDMADNVKLLIGTGDDIEVFHDGNHSYIDNHTGNLKIRNAAAGNILIQARDDDEGIIVKPDGAVELYHDNNKKIETTSGGAAVSTTNNGFSIGQVGHTGGNVRLDIHSATSGVGSLIRFLNDHHDAAYIGLAGDTTGNFIMHGGASKIEIKPNGSAAVELFHGTSKRFETTAGGTIVTGTIDTTGTIACGGHIKTGTDTGKFFAGASNDLQIYHNGSHSYIDDAGTGNLYIRGTQIVLQSADGSEDLGIFSTNGAAKLYYDNSKKLETNSTGIHIFGNTGHADGAADLYGSGNDFSIYHDGTNSIQFFDSQVGAVKFRTDIGNSARNNIVLGQGVDLYHLNSKKAYTTSGGFKVDNKLELPDGGATGTAARITVGTGDDLKIYHDGTDSFVKNGTGVLRILGDQVQIRNNANNETGLSFAANGAVNLYYNNSKKFETTSNGVKITGLVGVNVTPTSHNNTTAFQIHDTYNSQGYPRLRLTNQSTGSTSADGFEISLDGSNLDAIVRQRENADIHFYTNNTEKLRIDSAGHVMIGTTTEGFAAYGDQFTIANSGHCGMTIRSGTSSDGNIYFSDGTSGADEVRGFVEYNHSSNFMNLGTDGGWKVRINSTGDLTNAGQSTSYVTTTFSANFAKLDLRGTNIANSNHYILSYGEGHANDHEFHMVNIIGDLVFRTNAGSNTERLRIKSSGVVMAGMDNFSGNVTQALDIRGRYVNAEGDFARLMFRNSSDSGGSSASIRALRTGDNYGTNLTFWTQLHGGSSGGDGLERLRIETDGDMRLVNGDFNIGNSDTTGGNFIIFGKNGNSIPAIIEFHGKNSSGGGNPKAQIKGVNNTYAWASDLRFYTQDHNINLSEHFRIQYNGDLLATDTSIGSLSDSRLKTNITNYTYDLSKFKQFQPKTFDWKNPIQHGGKSGVRGFLAQDLESIDSSYVSSYLIEKTVTKGNDDGTTTTTDNPDLEHLDADGIAKASKFGPKDAMYISVINQLISKIETLETKVAAL